MRPSMNFRRDDTLDAADERARLSARARMLAKTHANTSRRATSTARTTTAPLAWATPLSRIAMLSAALLSAMLLMTGCSDKHSINGPDAAPVLTATETHDLLTAFDQVGFDSDAAATAGKPLTQSCQQGGTVMGTATWPTATDPYSMDLSLMFRGCKVTSDAGRTWTLDSDAPLRFTQSSRSDAATKTIRVTVTLNGNLHFASNGTSGMCPIDVKITSIYRDDLTFLSGGEITGTYCGHSALQVL